MCVILQHGAALNQGLLHLLDRTAANANAGAAVNVFSTEVPEHHSSNMGSPGSLELIPAEEEPTDKPKKGAKIQRVQFK